MVPDDPAEHPALNRRRKGNKGAKKQEKKVPGLCVPRPEDLSEEVKCTYPEWQKFLERYPMINPIQPGRFSGSWDKFCLWAHFYRTKDNAEESSFSREEFEHFFTAAPEWLK